MIIGLDLPYNDQSNRRERVSAKRPVDWLVRAHFYGERERENSGKRNLQESASDR